MSMMSYFVWDWKLGWGETALSNVNRASAGLGTSQAPGIWGQQETGEVPAPFLQHS